MWRDRPRLIKPTRGRRDSRDDRPQRQAAGRCGRSVSGHVHGFKSSVDSSRGLRAVIEAGRRATTRRSAGQPGGSMRSSAVGGPAPERGIAQPAAGRPSRSCTQGELYSAQVRPARRRARQATRPPRRLSRARRACCAAFSASSRHSQRLPEPTTARPARSTEIEANDLQAEGLGAVPPCQMSAAQDRSGRAAWSLAYPRSARDSGWRVARRGDKGRCAVMAHMLAASVAGEAA